jgi:hypothetical protein
MDQGFGDVPVTMPGDPDSFVLSRRAGTITHGFTAISAMYGYRFRITAYIFFYI